MTSNRPLLVALLFLGFSFSLTACGGGIQQNLASTAVPPPGPPGSNSGVPHASHVVLVIEENHSYTDVIGSPAMPYFNQLASQNALATNYFADAHPSLPNYFMLTTGQTIAIDDSFSGTVTVDTLAHELIGAGISWKVYAESLPSVGYTGADDFPYIKHHNPFVYFQDVLQNPAALQNIVPFTQFSADLSANNLPTFSLVVPNAFDDAHSCATSGCSDSDKLATADTWLKTNIDPLISSPAFQNGGLLIVLFDESVFTDLQNGGGHVAMVMAGPKVKKGFQSTTFYQHESTLRTIIEATGAKNFPANAGNAPDMAEFF
jgi:acid phosphatase